MSAYSITSPEHIRDEITGDSPWLSNKMISAARSIPRTASAGITEIRLDVKMYSKDALQETVEDVCSWTPTDLYMYSEAPFVELANAFGELEFQCQNLQELEADPLEFELRTIDLWQQVKALNRFLRISSAHDELIASLAVLSYRENSVIDDIKLNALISVFSELKNIISINDERLDEIYDRLETAGFDLNTILT